VATTTKKIPVTAWKKGQSGNPRGRVPGLEIIRKLLDPHRKDLINKAVELAKSGDATALRLCIDRIAPPPRTELPPIKIPGLANAKGLSEKARTIIDAAGEAIISPDSAAMLLGALASACKIIETDELSERIAALEAMTEHEEAGSV